MTTLKLWNLLHGVPLTGAFEYLDMEINSISYDSRTARSGGLFVALPGEKTDGGLYIREAMERGAAAVVCRTAPEEDGPWIVTPDPRLALALQTKGLINIQYVIHQDEVYVIEVNPRSSRTVPYLSKVTGIAQTGNDV